METVKRPMVAGVWELGEEDRIGEAQGIFRAVQLLCDTIMVDTCPYIHSTKPIEGTSSRVSGGESYELWVNMVGHCRFLNCKKCTTLVGDADYMGKSLYLPLNFAVNLKL